MSAHGNGGFLPLVEVDASVIGARRAPLTAHVGSRFGRCRNDGSRGSERIRRRTATHRRDPHGHRNRNRNRNRSERAGAGSGVGWCLRPDRTDPRAHHHHRRPAHPGHARRRGRRVRSQLATHRGGRRKPEADSDGASRLRPHLVGEHHRQGRRRRQALGPYRDREPCAGRARRADARRPGRSPTPDDGEARVRRRHRAFQRPAGRRTRPCAQFDSGARHDRSRSRT